ncbi:class III aminotransferase [Gordoniibacillus kamchatkensis]|uniref:Class III aminotransferase n=1 Tax=Gordoniibacillus kamchatkensis TaxID=1590651 RepID=A0ABR5AH13_9BACL|nr:aspartate aminotransferase family protein [Paenibacillus sp. VKM B-2647]KIL40334.1 class III aminotransferase [Paenibacillus sp. VKM B-2647]
MTMTYQYEQSKIKFEASRKYLAQGVASSLRAAMKPVPLFVESASGSRLRDVDGNEYIDYMLGYGPLILGHSHPALVESVHEAMLKGSTYGLQHDGEITLARRLTELLPCAESVALSGSGTEAVMLALRLARAYTAKRKIVRFHGHYHGWSDTIFTSFPSSDMKPSGAQGQAQAETRPLPGTGGQSEIALSEVILLPWNDPDLLERTLRAGKDEIAVVITEPVMCNSGCILPLPGYLERMRGLTKELGIVMVMDEVITGFRIGIGGAHGHFGLMPDLVTVGKALGGGVAVSAVAGKSEIMKLLDNGAVSHLGTLNGNCIATSAALATLDVLTANGGAVYGSMNRVAGRLVQGLRDAMAKQGKKGIVNQFGPVFHMMFTAEERVDNFASFNKRDAGAYGLFAERMLEEGVLLRPNGLWYVSVVHNDEDVRQTVAAAERAMARM